MRRTVILLAALVAVPLVLAQQLDTQDAITAQAPPTERLTAEVLQLRAIQFTPKLRDRDDATWRLRPMFVVMHRDSEGNLHRRAQYTMPLDDLSMFTAGERAALRSIARKLINAAKADAQQKILDGELRLGGGR